MFPLRAMARGAETIIEDARTGRHVAIFSEPLAHISTHPTARLWTGALESYLCIIQLEGDLELSGNDS